MRGMKVFLNCVLSNVEVFNVQIHPHSIEKG